MNQVAEQLEIHGEPDIVAARQVARRIAAQLGFGSIDQGRIVTAVSELTRNVVRYATNGEGRVHLREIGGDGRRGLEIVVEDDGPGIADTQLVMQDGYTSGGGMGLGLPGTKRLMDEMQIVSSLGTGTKVTVRKWRR